MDHEVYINGTVVVEHGIFYAKNFYTSLGINFKNKPKIISPPEGLFYITEDYGSIFTTYFISGGITCKGIDDGNARAFFDDHEETYELYKNNICKIEKFLNDIVVPSDLMGLFYQQQYISVFGALENFLFNTFMRQVCNNYELYRHVISNKLDILVPRRSDNDRNILCGPDCIEKEKTFIKKVQKIVFHNHSKVDILFKTAFNIMLNMHTLEPDINIRHDLVHRMGYTLNGNFVQIRKQQVEELITKVNSIVEIVTTRIKELSINN